MCVLSVRRNKGSICAQNDRAKGDLNDRRKILITLLSVFCVLLSKIERV